MKAKLLLPLVLCALACGERVAENEQLPVPISDPSPIEYPVSLWDRDIDGETELLVHVSDMGAVDSVLVSRSSGVEELDSAAVTGARKLRFTPGRRGERRIAKWIRLPVRFTKDSIASLGTATDSSAN